MNSSAVPEERLSYQNIGLIAGPLVFAVMMLLGIDQAMMPEMAWRVAAVGLWMGIWWATEAIPVPATAFLPLVCFDLLGIAPIAKAAQSYAHPIIYLFLGAFILALAVERWNLHKRIALMILSQTGTDGARLILGFMVVAAVLSMWMTNTSTTMMLMPIAVSVAAVVTENMERASERDKRNFQIALLLGLAYAATIGGLATLVGTPPNILLAGFLVDTYGIEISFLNWMLVGVPVSIVLLPLAWLILTRWAFAFDIPESEGARAHLQRLRAELGPMSSAEKRVAVIFVLVILAWMFRRVITESTGLTGLSDTGVAMTAALLLFLVPSGSSSQSQLMVWHDVGRLPWGVLVLFGGGLSLASAVSQSGLALWLGEGLSPLSDLGVIVVILAAAGLVIFLTELTSNLATAATFLPVIAAIATQSGIDVLMLVVPVTLAASCAFMLPVATPPNAIVFASGFIRIPDMVRAGVYLNIVSMLLLTAVALWLAPAVLQP
ncbi:SLC13 family permease [Aequoribacter sp.]|uniref:SLC13 family permease n=1 Tax=Aequoribacter sp. TaxID=2847771 RepID=UPI003F69EF6B